ncbi:MAG: YjgP/YjgQ family permease [Bacteroidia bacterium]|nr:YjgP/YjgQ family permease [Bacteroidia bacterium]
MKILYRFILKSFAGPLVLTFIIALFVLMMQFLWKYIDDLVGKGLSWYLIVKMMGLATITLIPMALPLAILLASIMTFGNLAENHELVALKAAGLSLPRIMSSLIVLNIVISIAAFFFSNNMLPYVNLKMGSLLYDIRTAKPALNIPQDVFYNGIDGYSIRFGVKKPDQESIENIMIYDHTANQGNVKVYLAKRGRMKMSSDKHYLVLNLYDGNGYTEMSDNPQQRFSRPLLCDNFKSQTLYLDLSSFKFSRTNEDLFKYNYEMMNMHQLRTSADSLDRLLNKNKKNFYTTLNTDYLGPARFTNRMQQPSKYAPGMNRISVLDLASELARNAKTVISTADDEFKEMQDSIARREIEWQRKITFSVACFILFFIGAPLGAIIKKGGLGMPVVVSTLFFILFYILSITGEKFAREQVTSVIIGMWAPSVILFPIGIFLTYKASMDSALFNPEWYMNFVRRVGKLIRPG